MFTLIGGLFHNFVFLVCAAVVMALIGVIMAIYAIYRYRNYQSDVRWKHILRGLIVIGAVIFGAKLALDAYNIHAATPPPEEPAEIVTADDEDYFGAIDFDHDLLVAHFNYVGHQLDMTSMLEAQTRSRAIEAAYGTTFSDSVSTPLRTLKEVEAFKKLPDGDKRDAELQEMLRDMNKVSIESLVPALAQLEWLASEEYFTKNNPCLIVFYNEIMYELLHGGGWSYYLTKAIGWTENNPVYDINDDLWDKLAYVRLFFEAARLRGIEHLTSTTNWHLPEGQKGSTAHCVRLTDPKDQDSMYWFLYDFSKKDELAEDGGSAPRYLVGDNTADKRFGTFEVTAKEETPKSNDTPNDNGKKPDPEPDPEPAPPPTIVVTPDPAPVTTYTVTERFVDLKGNQIARDNQQSARLEAGKKWSASYNSKLADDGYVLVKTTTNAGDSWTGRDAFAVTGKMPAQNLVVTFHYELKPLLVIRYKDAHTKKEFTDLRVEKRIAEGEYYEEDSPTAAELRRWGYGDYKAPDRVTIEGTMGSRDVEETVWYTPKNTTVVIHFRNIANEEPVAQDEKLTEETGTSRTYYPGDIKGYTLVTTSKWIVFEYGNEYTIYYRQKTVVPPDGQGGKNPGEDPVNKGNADKGGGDRQHDNNNSEKQESDPGHADDTVVGTDGNVTENRGDSSGQSGAGSESTTDHDSTGTGSKTDPIVTVPDTGHTNGGTPSANNPINQTTGDAATGSTTNNSGGNTNITQGTNDAVLGNGTVLDTD